MLDAADAARRRELQRRAYAPGGALTRAEAAELHALDSRSLAVAAAEVRAPEPVAPVAPEVAQPAPDATAESAHAREEHPLPAPPQVTTAPLAGAPAADTAASEHTNAPATETPAPSRRRWLLPLVAALAILLGFGGGWLAFARGDGGSAMSDEQQDIWARIEASGTYDPGSVRLLGDKYGVNVWQATKDGSTTDCLILTHDEDEKTGCVLPEQMEEAYYYGPQTTLSYNDGDDEYMLWATFIEDVTGERRVIVQRQSSADSWDWRSQYDERELATAEMFVESGFDGQFLQIVGYDGDIPVWLYEADRTCLLVEQTDGFAEHCGALMYASEPTLELEMPDVTYSVHASPTRGYDLTIVRHAEGGTTAVQ
ncbi:hypothetical protein [Microbacterium sp. NPDC058345]|uniref:hypothetical protein n=1 Tax=Microbacterium sp. NPDC058345 TaxID=3346455 RepID=UPI003667E9DD